MIYYLLGIINRTKGKLRKFKISKIKVSLLYRFDPSGVSKFEFYNPTNYYSFDPMIGDT